MADAYRLPLHFQPDRLLTDLGQIAPEEWVPHFNIHYHDGGWSGVALRSAGGNAAGLFPDPQAARAVASTPLLDRCPYFAEVLSGIRCSQTSARLLRLASGSVIREHRDYELAFEDGEIRLHIPVATSPDVEFALDGRPVVMAAGECWYLNLNLPHRVANRGAVDRVHLVVDCVVNDWLRSLFPPEVAAAGRSGFEQFHAAVLADPALQERLATEQEAPAFVGTAVRLGRERGHRFSRLDVEDAIRAGRRAWLERWI
jgi:Aspartyl/Asparaginyl beta-hydroxylase/Nif11 domain